MFAAAWVPNTGMVVYGNYMQDLEPVRLTRILEKCPNLVSANRLKWVYEKLGDVVTSLNAFQIVRPLLAQYARAAW